VTLEIVLFSIFASTAIIGALFVVLPTDPVKSALSLVGSFFSIACLYLLQAAELIAVLEVLVYAGAIMVLFVFVIMLVDTTDNPVVGSGLLQRMAVPVKVTAVLLVCANVIVVLWREPLLGTAKLTADFGSPKAVGRMFFTDFPFQFELTSVLLLVAIVGALLLSRRDDEGEQR
jgi:NADH-quinone oxidoreductase subunit J